MVAYFMTLAKKHIQEFHLAFWKTELFENNWFEITILPAVFLA